LDRGERLIIGIGCAIAGAGLAFLLGARSGKTLLAAATIGRLAASVFTLIANRPTADGTPEAPDAPTTLNLKR
jgi:hypothetical protein